MKILFKNTTQYTKENCNQFIEFNTKKYGKRDFIKMALLTICIAYILIFNLIHKNWLFIIIALLLGIIFYLFYQNQLQKKEKSKKKVKEFTFFFYERYIKIKYKRQFERLSYFSLYKIFETKQYFYLYLDEKSSLILDKKGFSIGTAEGFSKFIKEKCPFKFSKESERMK